jgi:hypothetical protein
MRDGPADDPDLGTTSIARTGRVIREDVHRHVWASLSSLRSYLARRCSCCSARVPKGTGYEAVSSFERLCDGCMANCCLLTDASGTQWVHGPAVVQ